MNKVVITGCDGQDGQYLAELLRSLGYSVVGITNRNRDYNFSRQNQITKQTVDYSVSSECWKSLDSIQPNHIFHFAGVHAGSHAMSGKIYSSSVDMNKTHVESSKNILEWQRFNQSFSHFSLSSKMFTPVEKHTEITEESIPLPSNFYGETKAACWGLIRNYRDQYQVSANGYILFPHYSKYSKPGFFAYDWADRIYNLINNHACKEMESIEDVFLDVSHAADICSAVVKCAKLKIVGDFVLGSGKLIKVSTIMDQLLDKLDLSFKLPIDQKFVDSPKLISNYTKIREVTGWEPMLAPYFAIYEILMKRFQEKIPSSKRK